MQTPSLLDLSTTPALLVPLMGAEYSKNGEVTVYMNALESDRTFKRTWKAGVTITKTRYLTLFSLLLAHIPILRASRRPSPHSSFDSLSIALKSLISCSPQDYPCCKLCNATVTDSAMMHPSEDVFIPSLTGPATFMIMVCKQTLA